MSDATLKIGPTFFAELQANNPTGEGCGWNIYSGQLVFADGTSQQFIIYAQGVLAAHDPTQPLPPTVPTIISDRQFFQQLAVMGKITQAEAMAAVQTGTIPAAMTALVAQLPADEQFSANMMLCGATSFERNNTFVPVIGQLYGMTSAQLDTLWITAYAL